MITALLFDFGGTLDGPKHWLDRFLVHYRAAGIDIERSELDPAFEHATRIGYKAGRVVQRFGLVDLVRFLAGNQVEFLARSGPQPIRERMAADGPQGRHRAVEQITAGFVEETRAGLAQSRTVLAGLRPRFRLGIVSNFYANLDRVIAEARLANLVDATVDSNRVGVFKPEPGIFEAALRAIGAAARDAAMVGDSLDKDCRPARALGLTTVWFNAGGARIAESAGKQAADFTIADLEELKALEWGGEI
jgi:FMN phosphatase YigB (HAD superfamily)